MLDVLLAITLRHCVSWMCNEWFTNLICLFDKHHHSNSGTWCLLSLQWFKAIIRSHFFLFNNCSKSVSWNQVVFFPLCSVFKAPTCQNEATFSQSHTRALSHKLSKVVARKLLGKCRWFEKTSKLEYSPFRVSKNTCRAYQWSTSVVFFWSGTHYFHYTLEMLGSLKWNITKIKCSHWWDLALFSPIEELLKNFSNSSWDFYKNVTNVRPALSQTEHRSPPRPRSTHKDVLIDGTV